jgi:hypothetical protein
VPAQLIGRNGITVNVPSVEFFTRRRMVWIRSMVLDADSLKEVVIDGISYGVLSIENKASLCEVRFELE